MADTAKDFLAVITVSGCGSWAREPDREKAIKSVAHRFRLDFKNVFKLKNGESVNIDVLDVTGHDKVWWDDRGFYTKDETPFVGPVERVQHTYKRWK